MAKRKPANPFHGRWLIEHMDQGKSAVEFPWDASELELANVGFLELEDWLKFLGIVWPRRKSISPYTPFPGRYHAPRDGRQLDRLCRWH